MTVEIFGENSSEVPKLFEELIDKIKVERKIDTNEYLYAAVLYIALEMGFVVRHPTFKNHILSGFNQQVITNIFKLPLNEIYEFKPSPGSYIAELRLGPEGNPVATLIGQPSEASKTKYMTVHFFIKSPKCLSSHCFQTEDYVSVNGDKFKPHKLDRLARAIKDHVILPVKQPLLLFCFEQCVPHLLGLPDHVLAKIKSYLPSNTRRRLEEVIN